MMAQNVENGGKMGSSWYQTCLQNRFEYKTCEKLADTVKPMIFNDFLKVGVFMFVIKID